MESPGNRQAGRKGSPRESHGLKVEVRNAALPEGPLVASKATIVTSPRHQAPPRGPPEEAPRPSARKATPRNPKIVKIKPGEEGDPAAAGLSGDRPSAKELLSLIPSRTELEGMNLKKFAFLQQRRRNSQMDIQD